MPLLSTNSNTVRVNIETTGSTTGIDKTTKSLQKMRGENTRVSSSAQKVSGAVDSSASRIVAFGTVAAASGVATHKLTDFMGQSIEAANRLQSAMTGLNSVATAFKENAGDAKNAAQDLAKDGLMTVADSATSLKNLLAAGFNLDQSIQLINRFRDSAAFGRQSSLSFGEAIRSATEGIKNGNSILVDNAGVTKNLSLMLTDAGFSASDLMRAGSDASVRMAIFNGIMKETNAQLGDAAKLANSAAGKQAQMSAQTEVLKQKIGLALQPALLSVLKVMTPIVSGIATWVAKNPELASSIMIGTTALIGMIGVLNGALTAITVVKAAHVAMAGVISTPIIMPAIAVGAALAALGLVIAKTHEVIATVKTAADDVAAARKSTEETDSKIKKLYKEGRISAQRYQTYLENTSRAADKAKANMYGGFFGPMNRALDDLFVRITGTSEKFKGSGFAGRATGGPVSPGNIYAVGDNPDGSFNRTTELFVPDRPGRIVNAKDTQAMLGGGGKTINIQNVNLTTGQAVRTFFGVSDQNSQMASLRLSQSRGGAVL